MKIRSLVVVATITSLTSLAPAVAQAQNRQAMQQLVELNRQAMEAYARLDVDGARQRLQRALELADVAAITGSLLATTHVNLGIVYVGGLGDNRRGMDEFRLALQADPSIQLDPLTATAEVQTLFNLASRARGPVDSIVPINPIDPVISPQSGLVIHTPPVEQLQETPVPIYAEVPPFITVGSMFLFYKGTGMREFERVAMTRVGAGYGGLIPCLAVFPRSTSYYVSLQDAAGAPIGSAGTAARPLRVPVVSTRTPGQAPISLPGQPPPQTCSDTDECPPLFPGCHNVRCGDHQCDGDEEATCPDDCITAGGAEPRGDEEISGLNLHFFGTIGGGVGLGFVRGDVAFSTDGNHRSRRDIRLEAANPDEPDQPHGEEEIIGGGTALSPGFLRAEAGLMFLDDFSLSANFRFQFITYGGEAESSKFLPFHIEARLAWWFLKNESLWAYAFAGSGFGQIQPTIDVDGETYFQQTGFNNASLGGGALIRLTDMLGINIQLDLDLLFPSTYFNIDLSAGVQITL